MIVDRIEAHFRGAPRGAAGNAPLFVLRLLERLVAGRDIGLSVETGCGVSTVLMSAVSARHLVFAEDDRASPTSGLLAARGCPIARPDRIEFIHGDVAQTLPRHAFDAAIDVAYLGGCHRHPFPVAEFALLAPRLAPGAGLLVLHDVPLPHVRRLYDHLNAAEAFVLVGLAGGTAFFRRTESPVDPLPADWADRRLPPNAIRVDGPAEVLALAADAARHGTTDIERAQLAANHGAAALAAGELDTAEAAFRAAIALQRDNAEAYDGLATLALHREQPDKAVPLRRWATLLDPLRAALQLDLARDFIRQRRITDAEATLIGLLRRAPDHREALDLLGELCAALGRAADADACAKRARQPGPEGPLPVYFAGTQLDFTHWGNALRFVGRGWQDAEGWGRWTRAGEATIDFLLDPRGGEPGENVQAILELDAGGSYAGPDFAPSLDVLVNGMRVASRPQVSVATPGNTRQRFAIRFDSRFFRAGRANTIALVYHTPLIPRLVSDITDPRVLGVVVSEMRLSFRPKDENVEA